MVHEELLLLIDAGGEALFRGLIDGLLNVFALLLSLKYSLFLLRARLSSFFPPQVSSEVGVCTTLVVEVDRIGC